MGLWSLSSENLLIGTYLTESEGGSYIHQIGGPALGIFQMEKPTHDWLREAFLVKKSDLASKLYDIGYKSATADNMVYDMRYAAIMCRLKYYSSPEIMPDKYDIQGLAHMWKIVYNSRIGKGDPKKFAAYLEQYLKLVNNESRDTGSVG